MLKWSTDEEKIAFANVVLNFINPKFESQEEYNAAKFVLIDFAQKCELTANEFLLALEMSADGKLFDGEQKVKIYREIDRLKLGEIKAAYINFKRQDKQYEIGRNKIRELLNPEPVISPEQKREQKLQLWETLKKSVSENKPCHHAFLFYDSLVAKGHFKNFISNKEAQKIVLKKKMNDVIIRENRHPVIFSKIEARKLFKEISDGKEVPVHNIAIVEVKNDLVYSHVKKQLKRKIS